MIRIVKYGEAPSEEIFTRPAAERNVSGAVSAILQAVRLRGDAALLTYTRLFDRAALTQLAVTPEEISQAMQTVEPAFLKVLRRAADNIRAFHSRQVRGGFEISRPDGVVIGQRVIPLERVGIYVPGGTAAYPSTVLMDAVPARLAGCGRVVMVTPPGADGAVSPAILAAASIAGVDEIYKVGGAQAIAALAYGTESIPRVDKIVGPGNAFVAEAKRQVFGQVAIDMIAGPSEILILADKTCQARLVAADLLSQAEHDRLAAAMLVTDSPALARAVQEEIERQLPLLQREAIARASVEANGRIILTEDLDAAIDIANRIAPEHLALCVDDPFPLLERIRHAGSVFLGKNCPEAVGDYFAGPNHTLPTSGTARFSSPLSVEDFVKRSQYTYYTGAALASVAEDIALFAQKEGLTGHARSVLSRAEDPQ